MAFFPAHIHPKTTEKSVEGGRFRTALKSMAVLVQYCEDCLWTPGVTVCQHGRKRCKEKKIWMNYLKGQMV